MMPSWERFVDMALYGVYHVACAFIVYDWNLFLIEKWDETVVLPSERRPDDKQTTTHSVGAAS